MNGLTCQWFKQLSYHGKDLGSWRRRRNALPNIMMSTRWWGWGWVLNLFLLLFFFLFIPSSDSLPGGNIYFNLNLFHLTDWWHKHTLFETCLLKKKKRKFLFFFFFVLFILYILHYTTSLIIKLAWVFTVLIHFQVS